MPLRVGLVQLKPSASRDENLRQARAWSVEATADGADLLVLPEYFGDLFGVNADPRDPAHPPEILGEGPISRFLSELASELGVTVHGGSFLERDGERVYNTTAIFDPSGAVVAVYRKQHPFSCPAVPTGSGDAESDFIAAGSQPAIYEVKDLRVGCATCWDLRFPSLFEDYRRRGCSFVVCPAAFFAGVPTDTAFWESLLRGRAIDLGGYVACATVVGTMPEAKEPRGAISFHGVTRLIDPFGHVVAKGEDGGPCGIRAELRLSRIEEASESHPA